MSAFFLGKPEDKQADKNMSVEDMRIKFIELLEKNKSLISEIKKERLLEAQRDDEFQKTISEFNALFERLEDAEKDMIAKKEEMDQYISYAKEIIMLLKKKSKREYTDIDRELEDILKKV